MSIEKRPKSAHARQIVFTNGVFDLFHHGHAEFLRKASQEGDYLLVGVTSDDSNREKRESRDSWETRASNVLKSPFVDAVIETPWSKFLTPEFYKEYDISLHVQGDNESDFGPARELNIFKVLGRTKNISTSMILEILDSAPMTELAGGDVNDVYRVSHNGENYVLKHAKRHSAKNYNFHVPLLRVRDEYDALVAFRAALSDPNFIAEPIWTDSSSTLLLRAFPFESQTLAAGLSKGRVSENLLCNIMSALAMMHEGTRGNSELESRFGNTRGFREVKLGVQCFQASRDAGLVEEIRNLIEVSKGADHCLLHGDFAPKNILFSEEKFSLIDFEESGYWDPALDVGYFFAHLIISAICNTFEDLNRPFWPRLTKLLEAYSKSSTTLGQEFEQNVTGYVGVFILSRLDSPAPDRNIPVALRASVRKIGKRILLERPKLVDLESMIAS